MSMGGEELVVGQDTTQRSTTRRIKASGPAPFGATSVLVSLGRPGAPRQLVLSSNTLLLTNPSVGTAVCPPSLRIHPFPDFMTLVIVALVNASGRLGLSAVLPHPDRRSPSSDSPPSIDESSVVPHLPLVADWRDGRFALYDVMKDVPNTNVREWSMRILQRYRHVIGAFSLSYCGPSHYGQLSDS